MNKKHDANKFLEIQYSIIKNELAQANAKINSVLTFGGILFAGLLTSLGLVWTIYGLFKNETNYLIFIPITISIVIICFMFTTVKSIRIAGKALKSFKKHNIDKKSEMQIDVTNFWTYRSISEDEFIGMFNLDSSSELDILMLKQVFVNGRMACTKYQRANEALKWLTFTNIFKSK